MRLSFWSIFLLVVTQTLSIWADGDRTHPFSGLMIRIAKGLDLDLPRDQLMIQGIQLKNLTAAQVNDFSNAWERVKNIDEPRVALSYLQLLEPILFRKQGEFKKYQSDFCWRITTMQKALYLTKALMQTFERRCLPLYAEKLIDKIPFDYIWALREDGDVGKAVQSFNKLLGQLDNPRTTTFIKIQQAITFRYKGELDHSIDELNKLLLSATSDDMKVRILDHLGRNYRLQGKLTLVGLGPISKARALIASNRKLAHQEVWFRYLEAEIFRDQRKPASASKIWQSLLEDPLFKIQSMRFWLLFDLVTVNCIPSVRAEKCKENLVELSSLFRRYFKDIPRLQVYESLARVIGEPNSLQRLKKLARLKSKAKGTWPKDHPRVHDLKAIQ